MWITLGIVLCVGVANFVVLMRCGAKGFQRDTAADREALQAAHASTLAVGKAAMLQFDANKELRSEVRQLSEHVRLLTELEQARHAALFINVDPTERSA